MADAKAQVLKLLRGREAARMNFQFPGGAGDILISKASFETVAAAIDAGKVHVSQVTTLPAGVGAQYTGTGTVNLMEVPAITGRVIEAYIMHECIHAYLDLISSNVQDVPEEAAAYVVADLYAKMTNLSDARFSGTPFDEARPLANAILRHRAKGTAGVPVVDATAWATLIAAVRAIPDYAALGTGSTGHDG